MPEPSTLLNAASSSEKPSLLQNVRLLSLGRLLAVCFFLGVGIGVGVVGTSSALKWRDGPDLRLVRSAISRSNALGGDGRCPASVRRREPRRPQKAEVCASRASRGRQAVPLQFAGS